MIDDLGTMEARQRHGTRLHFPQARHVEIKVGATLRHVAVGGMGQVVARVRIGRRRRIEVGIISVEFKEAAIVVVVTVAATAAAARTAIGSTSYQIC